MAEIMNVQRLPESVRHCVVKYVEKLIGLHGDNILSVAVYGSAADGNFIPKVSDINIAVVLKNLSFDDLRCSLHLVREGRAHRMTAPLFLTHEYIRKSLDVFPVEFLDLRDHHILLFGEDVFSSIPVDVRHLKLFCEEQIKGKLLRVRQAYLEIGLNAKGKETLLKDSLGVLMPIFRNLLRLVNKPIPSGKEDLLKEVGREFNVDHDVLLAIYRDSINDEKIGGRDIDVHLEKYIDLLEKISDRVD